MDDWHHVKTVHLFNGNNIQYFENNEQTNCNDGEKCIQFTRYRRDRNSDKYTDHQNIVFMDRLDSIHTYLYHESPSRFRNAFQNEYNTSLSFADEIDISALEKSDNIEKKENLSGC
eukprot:343860_1